MPFSVFMPYCDFGITSMNVIFKVVAGESYLVVQGRCKYGKLDVRADLFHLSTEDNDIWMHRYPQFSLKPVFSTSTERKEYSNNEQLIKTLISLVLF